MSETNGTAYRLAHLETELSAHDQELSQLREMAIRTDERWRALNASVEACWKELTAIREAEEERAKNERQARKDAEREKKKDRNRAIVTTTAIVSAILTAGGLVANQLNAGVVLPW